MSKALRHFAVDLLTGSAGRFAAFVLDVGSVGGAYLAARLAGRRPSS